MFIVVNRQGYKDLADFDEAFETHQILSRHIDTALLYKDVTGKYYELVVITA